MDLRSTEILVCAGVSCISSNCHDVKAAILDGLKEHGLADKLAVKSTGCIGSCDFGPVVIVYPEGTLYRNVRPSDVPEIVTEHLLGGRPVERLLYVDPQTGEPVRDFRNIKFFASQRRVVLRNCGLIDPLDIDEYIAHKGYEALRRAVTEMTPEGVIATLKASGLRGRGGGGFPTGLKWELARQAPGDTKYVVCNADEGDPGAFMDRSVLWGDPHSVIEAMAIAGYAVGASQGYIYCRAENPQAIDRLGFCINQARDKGFLGAFLFGTTFEFSLDIRVAAGAFVCGEETALLASVEGQRGQPHPKPPFPSEAGLWGKPTVLNNVETFASICPIILNGAEWYASTGTEKSKGTKVFALAGNINNTGLVEVPLGTTLRELVYGAGGGIPNGKRFKAAQTGGPSGGCIPASHLDVALDYESLRAIGTMIGSGGLIVMDEDTCMVDIARYFMEFTQDESCGKCPPCRIGTKRMLEILERIVEGDGKPSDIEELESLGDLIGEASLCGLGQAAPNPVLATIRHFRNEYETHIDEKRCPAGACRSLRS